jgi:mannose-6-phosphate isomerase-like protein (cupin superfamily)
MRNGSSGAGAVIIACWLLSAGCARVPSVTVPVTHGVDRISLDALLAAHPLPAAQNVSALPLGRTDALSYHLVQIRDREHPHVHATHDLAVTLLRGSGRLYVQGQAREMRAGDVAVVPHGTAHYFVNTDSSPAAAFVTFAPPFDGTDQVPVAPAP